ncbi:MAG: hypothetical protein HY329_14660 [Chloroflexi bacterium]|nr:hypothetical protein [Chloroflexota bacterium]
MEPRFSKIHLWDGGVYDNLGLEPLYKLHESGLRDEINFLIVSDASAGLADEVPGSLHRRAYRLLCIATEQVRALRARSVVNHLTQHPESGVYLRMGNAADYILKQAGVPEAERIPFRDSCLSTDEVALAAGFDTTLRRVSDAEFAQLYRHGWEVADCTLFSHCPGLFASRRQ